uniref:Venom allergen 5 n=1 Tax=Lygus hesperus TaxID=30085 RepID=A0A0A9X9W0_LYGHE
MVGISSHPSSFPTLLELWSSITNSNVTFHKMSVDPHKTLHNYVEISFKQDEPMSLITNPYFRYVGCAAAVFRQFEIEDEVYKTILVCNYGPLNVSYDKYHPSGYPCTRCPDDTHCNQKSLYPSLCFGTKSRADPPRREKPRSDWYEPQYDESEDDSMFEEEESSESKQLDNDGTRNANASYLDETRIKQNITKQYCSITCDNGGNHTMCKYQGKTDEFEEAVPLLSKKTKQYILFMHNDIRNNYAGNRPVQHPGYNLPLAANMRELVWNDELEKIASRWSMQCKIGHDECRDIHVKDHPQPVYVSQLHHAVNWTGMDIFPSAMQGFQRWLRGMSLLTPDLVDPFVESNQEGVRDYSSFAQLIWAETYMVGCAMTLCRSRNTNKSRIITVCNYAPGGMIPGKSIYKVGGPCSRCTKLRMNGNSGGAFLQ